MPKSAVTKESPNHPDALAVTQIISSEKPHPSAPECNHATPDAIRGTVQEAPFTDVWTRWGSKYRHRAVVLLVVNILLFSGVGCFAYWLRTGVFFAPSTEGYWSDMGHTFQGVGDAEVSLGALLVQPINVQDVPMQIPIIGLLMAAMISIPILVALLYRFWSSLPFVAIVGFIAVMPWLAITLLGSCILASAKPFRTRFRFMSALIGLVPAIVYLILAWSGTADIIRGRIDPVDRIKFITPWVFAVVASTVVFAVVLAIAKLVNFRPGAITPLLAVMLGLPVGLFELRVGRDELYYRLLESLDRAYFTDTNVQQEWQRAAERTWRNHPPPRPSLESICEAEQRKWQFQLNTYAGPLEAELTQHQVEISLRCDEFLKNFPTSPYATCVAFIKARAWDRRVDLQAFRADHWIHFYDDFPNQASRLSWNIVRANGGSSVLAAVAQLRLAQFEVRDGNVDGAMQRLDDLLRKFESVAEPALNALAKQGPLGRALARETPETSLRIPLDRVVLEARRLKELLAANRDSVHGYEPITGRKQKNHASLPGLISMDPRQESYSEQLRDLSKRYPRSALEDNIALEVCKASRKANERASCLTPMIAMFPNGDAMPEALLRLGVAQLDIGDTENGATTMARLKREFPNSIWARQAGRIGSSAAGEQVSSAN
ncbi:MAG: tetratricopeptide repeat protein [Planctomycetes bacterium]|nr:tetratricopeptide repeat protein [Planctomycetota bacterium]